MFAKKYKVVIALLLIAVIGASIAKIQLNKPTADSSPVSKPTGLQNIVPSKLYDQTPVDPKYPPAASTQLSFYRNYPVGDVSLEIQKGEVNRTEDNTTGMTFYINYINLTSKEIAYTDATDSKLQALNLGCIGHYAFGTYSTFKDNTTLFNRGGFTLDLKNLTYETTSLKAVASLLQKPGLNIHPNGEVKSIIEVQKDCLYLGTADGANYWNLK